MAMLRERTIDIRVTIDTDSVLRPRESPGESPSPTGIARGQVSRVVPASRGVKNQGAGDVVFEAGVGDALRFFISSGSNNFEQIVFLENICYVRGDEILNGF